MQGLSHEESFKTILLKSQIDLMTEPHNELGGGSSEDSNNSYDHRELSPKAREKERLEKLYRRKLTKVVDNFAERVENSSGSSGDEKTHKNMYNKKRKF